MEPDIVRKIQKQIEFNRSNAHIDAKWLYDKHNDYAYALYLELEMNFGYGREVPEQDHPGQQYLHFNTEA